MCYHALASTGNHCTGKTISNSNFHNNNNNNFSFEYSECVWRQKKPYNIRAHWLNRLDMMPNSIRPPAIARTSTYMRHACKYKRKKRASNYDVYAKISASKLIHRDSRLSMRKNPISSNPTTILVEMDSFVAMFSFRLNFLLTDNAGHFNGTYNEHTSHKKKDIVYLVLFGSIRDRMFFGCLAL